MKKKVPFVIAYWWCMALFLLGLLPFILGNREGGVSETENRTLQARGGVFSDAFDGFSRHVYRIVKEPGSRPR